LEDALIGKESTLTWRRETWGWFTYESGRKKNIKPREFLTKLTSKYRPPNEGEGLGFIPELTLRFTGQVGGHRPRV